MRIDSQRETYFWTLLPEQTPTMECSCMFQNETDERRLLIGDERVIMLLRLRSR